MSLREKLEELEKQRVRSKQLIEDINARIDSIWEAKENAERRVKELEAEIEQLKKEKTHMIEGPVKTFEF